MFADVQSANIVGYNQVTIHPGYNMFAVNWEAVANPEDGIAVNDLFPKTGITGGENSSEGDKVEVWKEDGSGEYDTYFFYYTTKKSFTSANYTWVKSAGTTTDEKILNGRCLWYYSRTNENVTASFSGAVSMVDTSRGIPIHSGYNMIGNPFPSTFKLNDASWGSYWEDLAKAHKAEAGKNSSEGDKIEVWHENADGEYDTYFLYYTTKKSFTSANYKWVKSAGTIYDGDFAPLGMGMYYKCLGSGFTLEMPSPVTK